jgi:hypothetical protein
VVTRSKVYSILLSIPILASSISYLTLVQASQTSNMLGAVGENNTRTNATTNATNINTTAGTEEQRVFIVNVTSGEKSIYERKAAWGVLQWGDGIIPILYISTIPTNKSQLEDQIVRIQAFQNNDVIYDKYVKTLGTGIYNASFYPPTDGTVKVKAMLIDNGKTVSEALITVIATQAWMPAILITIFIAASIGTIVLFWWISKWRSNPNWARAGVIPAVILNIFAYIVLYKFPPFDTAGNTAIAAALIAPMAAYIYEALKKTNGST